MGARYFDFMHSNLSYSRVEEARLGKVEGRRCTVDTTMHHINKTDETPVLDIRRVFARHKTSLVFVCFLK